MQRPISLAEKTKRALESLRTAVGRHEPERIAIAFTGGKDSTLALFFLRLTLAELAPGTPVTALNLDTGFKFPEILTFRDQLAAAWRLRLLIAAPLSAPATERIFVDKAAEPALPLEELQPPPSVPPENFIASTPAADKAACCRERKILPLLNALETHNISLLITGIRADEHPSRAAPSETHSGHERLHPLLDFTEADVWAATQEHDLPWCPLYAQGYRSLGCIPCTTKPVDGGAERSGRTPEKEAVMGELRALGYF